MIIIIGKPEFLTNLYLTFFFRNFQNSAEKIAGIFQH
jgi:hypothetical protein